MQGSILVDLFAEEEDLPEDGDHPVDDWPLRGVRAEAAQAEVVEELHLLGQAVVLALLGRHRVELQVVLLAQVHLLPLPRHLHREYVEHDLVQHHPEPEDVDLLREARLETGLFGGSVGDGEAALVPVGPVELGLQGGVALAEVDESQHEGGVGLGAVGHDLEEHVLRLEVVVDDAVVAQEPQSHCDLVQEEQLRLQGEETLVGLQVRVDRFQRTVLEQDLVIEPAAQLCLREEEAGDEERLAGPDEFQNLGFVDEPARLRFLADDGVDVEVVVFHAFGQDVQQLQLAEARPGQLVFLADLADGELRVERMPGLEVVHDQVRGEVGLLLLGDLVLAAPGLVVDDWRCGEDVEEGGEVVGEFVGVVVLVGHHLLVVDLLAVLLLAGEELGPDLADGAHAVDHLLLLEHEGVLDVALLYVLRHQAELLRLVQRPLLLVGAPEGVGACPHRRDAHGPEEARQEGAPGLLDLADLGLDEADEFVGGLADAALEVPEAVVDHLVDEHAALHVDAHAAERVLGVEVDRQVLADGDDLVAPERQQLVAAHWLRLVADVLQPQVDLHRDGDLPLLVLRAQQQREVQENAGVLAGFAGLEGEGALLELPLQGGGEGELVEAFQLGGLRFACDGQGLSLDGFVLVEGEVLEVLQEGLLAGGQGAQDVPIDPFHLPNPVELLQATAP